MKNIRVNQLAEPFFSKLYQEVEIDKKDSTIEEVQFVINHCIDKRVARILDIGCGVGRHAIPLAKEGHIVTGCDINPSYLETARERSKTAKVEVEWVLGEDYNLSYEGCFDVVLSFWTSFGYHNDEKNLSVLKNISRALLKGGYFVLEIHNRDIIANTDVEVKIDRVNSITLIKEYSFDPFTSIRHIKCTYLEEDRVIQKSELYHRLYALHELLNLFQLLKLEPQNVFRDLKGNTFIAGAKKMYIVARKND